MDIFYCTIYIYIINKYYAVAKVNTYAQIMAHLHGGATMWTCEHSGATMWTKICITPLNICFVLLVGVVQIGNI